jgi:hypothetical protein
MVRHMVGLIGNVKLVDLQVRDVQFALGTLAERLSARSVRLARMILIQAIRNAMVNDLVVRNVADLARRPDVRDGCPDGVSGVPIEQIADAVGHSSTRTTEVVYRRQLRPVARTAAIALGPLFEGSGKTSGGQS